MHSAESARIVARFARVSLSLLIMLALFAMLSLPACSKKCAVNSRGDRQVSEGPRDLAGERQPDRVILGTDGDFNVGVTSQADLIRLIEEKRHSGVFLSVLGFGMGNLKDATMEKLAQHGNGQYAYIDSIAEARKVFIQDIANLVPIARDVKVQVEFNPSWVQAYRLIGYEHRLLRDEDFNDDAKDAGDMGAGHAVTALYEIIPPGVTANLPRIDSLRYAQRPAAPAADNPELLTVKVRYLPPQGQEIASRLLVNPLHSGKRRFEDIRFEDMSPDFRFAAAAAAFGMLLRHSPHKGQATYADVIRWAEPGAQHDFDGRIEFLRLVRIAERLTAHASARR